MHSLKTIQCKLNLSENTHVCCVHESRPDKLHSVVLLGQLYEEVFDNVHVHVFTYIELNGVFFVIVRCVFAHPFIKTFHFLH